MNIIFVRYKGSNNCVYSIRYQNSAKQRESDILSEERQINKLDGLQLRFLNPDDLESVRALCSDWFPIDYPLSW